MSESVEQIVKALTEAWNSHEVERVVSFFAPHYEGTDVGDPETQQGQEGVRQMAARYLQAFPDLYFVIEDTIIQGNRAAVYWTASGTHLGRLMNIPPTRHMTKVRGITMLTIENGKIARALRIWDVAGLLRDLRLLPELSV